MVSGQRVLLIDGLSETEQVLKAVLEPRGLRVDRIRGAAPASAPLAEPAVVVFHDEYPGSNALDGVPRVIIGASVSDTETPSEVSQHLPHPFHYRELIHAIESLLATGRNREPAA